MNLRKKIFFIILFCIILINFASSLSEDAIETKNKIDIAQDALKIMYEREIPIIRANETLQEAIQIYSGQMILEKSGKNAKYDVILNLCDQILNLKEISTNAQDELKIFIETYKDYEKELDLAEMEEMYNKILLSFQEERFEETVPLIEKGYEKLSEIQSSQTTVKLFYKATSNSLKNFFFKYWVHIGILLIVFVFLILIFKKTIFIILVKRKINKLNFQKQNLNYLLKKLQKDYFVHKKVSEMEYNIKINKFEDMIRDINRQIPLLKEEIASINQKKENHPKKEILKDTQKLEKKVEETIEKEKKEIKKRSKKVLKNIAKNEPKKRVNKKISKKKK